MSGKWRKPSFQLCAWASSQLWLEILVTRIQFRRGLKVTFSHCCEMFVNSSFTRHKESHLRACPTTALSCPTPRIMAYSGWYWSSSLPIGAFSSKATGTMRKYQSHISIRSSAHKLASSFITNYFPIPVYFWQVQELNTISFADFFPMFLGYKIFKKSKLVPA